ncbi:hypothetical protein MRB53_000923 [Persea americana]|uniref:Uncharacterized protein n=1 Tax=Persea americana TaxID=3435 RepID=A0ACC2MR56_PERAE|nr:hypothetical protein MRB53_000923 [Persea americana]
MGAGVAEAASGDARGCCRREVGAGEHAATQLNTTVFLRSSFPVRSRTTTKLGCRRGHLLLRLGFPVSAFHAVVFSDNAEALLMTAKRVFGDLRRGTMAAQNL